MSNNNNHNLNNNKNTTNMNDKNVYNTIHITNTTARITTKVIIIHKADSSQRASPPTLYYKQKNRRK